MKKLILPLLSIVFGLIVTSAGNCFKAPISTPCSAEYEYAVVEDWVTLEVQNLKDQGITTQENEFTPGQSPEVSVLEQA